MEPTATTSNNTGLPIKESWSKPEVNLLGIKEETLGLLGNGGDMYLSSGS